MELGLDGKLVVVTGASKGSPSFRTGRSPGGGRVPADSHRRRSTRHIGQQTWAPPRRWPESGRSGPPSMPANGGDVIVNVGSINARLPLPMVAGMLPTP